MNYLKTPNETLEDMFKVYKDENKATLRQLRLIETDWPCAIELIREIFSEISDSLCLGSVPVSHRCINNGLTKYGKSLGDDDPNRLAAFVEGVTDCLGQDLERVSIIDKEHDSIWYPLCEESLSGWMKENNRYQRIEELCLSDGKCNSHSISKKLFEDLTSEEIKTVVEGEIKWLEV